MIEVMQPLSLYISERNGELSEDETMFVIIRNKENYKLDHIEFFDNLWSAWDVNGNEYHWKERKW